ncbi:MAG: nucleoside triphosphate pyrophosphatase [Pirellulaceae bacterium]|nr:nucleoside triphosphate pyrophosphatase [Pirellulaceae bacterium]
MTSPAPDVPLPLILASGSPRRAELMREHGYEFVVEVPSPEAECGMCSQESPPELVQRLAFQKAADVAPRISQGILIAADTVAHCHGQILGKPRNREHAAEMLRLMSGRVHQVYTGVVVWHRPSDVRFQDVVRTDLRMDTLSESELETYLDSDAWEGKAGAFGYQDGLDWVHIVEGEETNVVGLPMPRLREMLGYLKRLDKR